jgi:hypothetical protein
MRNNLKVVGGSAATRSVMPHEFDQRTRTDALDIEELVGQKSVLPNKSLNEYWRDYALYHQNVKSVVHTSRVFADCLTKWKADTVYTSSMTDIVLHPAYQRIIGLGPDVVPYVLQELSENGGHWFWALQALTGENPVPQEDRGRTKRMAAAWIEWGKRCQLL